MAKKNVGVDMALVSLKNGATTLVPRGQELPAGLADGEEKRLADLGVFKEPPVPSGSVPVQPDTAELDALRAEIAAQTARAEAAEKALADQSTEK